jgi:3-oxoacyl-[acyl-carrier protein] reductase
MFKSLAQKSVIVTGGSKGIGRGMAHVFAEKGAKVLIVSRDSEGTAMALVQEIADKGGEASFFKADVSQWQEVEAMVQAAINRHGGVDILCSNAGIYPEASIESISEADWDRVNHVNLKSAFLAVKACLPVMRQNAWGRIIFTSSITGPIIGFPGLSHYGATKAGMLGFIRSAALELAPYGITINAVLPGYTKVEVLETLGEDFIRQIEENLPMHRLVEPEDIAYAALFLASHEAQYITGQTLVVDGGESLR